MQTLQTQCHLCKRRFRDRVTLLQHQRESQMCTSGRDSHFVVGRGEAAAALGGAVLVGLAAALGASAMMPKVAERYTLDADRSGSEEDAAAAAEAYAAHEAAAAKKEAVVETEARLHKLREEAEESVRAAEEAKLVAEKAAARKKLGCANMVEKIIEFERKLPFNGFKASHLFPNEPNFRHGDNDGLALASKEDLLLPAGWAWVDEWHVLKGSSANQSGTDSDGWMYAFNWGIEYAGSSSMMHCVRQRIWSRIRTTASTLRNGHEECMPNYQSDGNPDKGKQTATATLPSGTGSGNHDLKDLFEKNGIADILQRATEELGIKSASDLKFIEKDDLDALSWLAPVTKRKLLLLMAESHV